MRELLLRKRGKCVRHTFASMSHTHTHTHMYILHFFSLEHCNSSTNKKNIYIYLDFYSTSSPNNVVSLDFRSSYDNYGHSVSLTFRGYLPGNPIPVYGTLPVPNDYIPIDFIDNFAPPVFDGSDLGLIGDISDLGQTLLVSGFNFSEFLNYKVGGASILSLIIGSGIFIYMGWCIVKWFLPT